MEIRKLKGPSLTWSGKEGENGDELKASCTLKEMSATELNVFLAQAVDSIHSGAIYDVTIRAKEITTQNQLETIKEQLLEAMGQTSILESVRENEQKKIEATV